MAMETKGPPPKARAGRASAARPLSTTAKSSLEAKIAAEAERLHTTQGTRRQGSIIIQGRNRTDLLREAARALAPGRALGPEGVGPYQWVVLGEKKGR